MTDDFELPEVPDPAPCGSAEDHPPHWPTATTFCYGKGPNQ